MPVLDLSGNFMDYAYVLDRNYETTAVIDAFGSFVWTERFNSSGDFIMTMPVTENLLPAIRVNHYLSIAESNQYMVIEAVSLITDVTDGDQIQISGRTLDSILDRRIVWGEYEKKTETPIVDIIRELLNANVISPSDSKRKIPNFTFVEPTDEKFKEMKSVVSLDRDNLFEVIQSLCKEHSVGFRVLPNGKGGFRFELYRGVDHSWSQTKNPFVVFSSAYENLLSSNYLQSDKEYISNAYVKGQVYEVEVYRKTERTGLDRREIGIDVDLDDNEKETKDLLLQKAKLQMQERRMITAFGGEVDFYHQFIFGKDYVIGDIVQLQNRYGYEGRCRVTEVIRSVDENGRSLTPTFISVDEDGEEVQQNV